ELIKATRNFASTLMCSGCWNVKVVFFFQAEDGIRDLYVTGVQTCALPIWAGSSIDFARSLHRCLQPEQFANMATWPQLEHWEERSEERRVGKECRSRWSADQ